MTVKVSGLTENEKAPPQKDAITFSKKTIKVLLVGNNPIQVSNYYNLIKKFRFRRFEVEYCFCLKDCLGKISNFKADCILIDDDFRVDDIKKLMNKLAQRSFVPPFVLMKDCIYKDIGEIENFNFIHKETLSSESLCRTILQTVKDNGVPIIKEEEAVKPDTLFVRNNAGFLFLKSLSVFIKEFFVRIMQIGYRLKRI